SDDLASGGRAALRSSSASPARGVESRIDLLGGAGVADRRATRCALDGGGSKLGQFYEQAASRPACQPADRLARPDEAAGCRSARLCARRGWNRGRDAVGSVFSEERRDGGRG